LSVFLFPRKRQEEEKSFFDSIVPTLCDSVKRRRRSRLNFFNSRVRITLHLPPCRRRFLYLFSGHVQPGARPAEGKEKQYQREGNKQTKKRATEFACSLSQECASRPIQLAPLECCLPIAATLPFLRRVDSYHNPIVAGPAIS
jgi:hypothetical protein